MNAHKRSSANGYCILGMGMEKERGSERLVERFKRVDEEGDSVCVKANATKMKSKCMKSKSAHKMVQKGTIRNIITVQWKNE